MKTKITFYLLLISTFAYSITIDDYFGEYQSINSDIETSFVLNKNGISNLFINDIRIDSTISFNYGVLGGNMDSTSLSPYLGYGYTVAFKVGFYNDDTYNCIDLFISKIEDATIIVGNYLRYKMDEDDKMTVIKKHVSEFIVKNIEHE